MSSLSKDKTFNKRFVEINLEKESGESACEQLSIKMDK